MLQYFQLRIASDIKWDLVCILGNKKSHYFNKIIGEKKNYLGKNGNVYATPAFD